MSPPPSPKSPPTLSQITVFSLLGMQFLVYILVIIGWILITGTFILCVIFLLLHKTADHFHGNGRAAQTWRPFRLLRSLEDH
ncbi:hypothetical protein CsSME_00019452 [Camellia sinensis var. sinensis]